MAEIAVELGTTANALGSLIARARAAGWDLPRRRRATPKTTGLTKQQVRAQFMNALLNGTLRRSTRCEECGDTELVEGHHTDYAKPLYVTWLCPACHRAAHGLVSHLPKGAA